MVEYIDKNATVGILEAMSRNADCECIKKRLEKAAKQVNTMPAADVAPVVRCKDCNHYRNYPNGLCYLHTEPKTNDRGYSGETVCVEPEDFCSYGERKDKVDAEG